MNSLKTCEMTSKAPTPTTYLSQDQNPSKPKLLDELRREIRVRHYSIRTEHTYADWVARFVRFHKMRHPNEMGAPEINQYLSFLATDCNVAASTQNQALCAIVFLYKNVLKREVGALGDVVRAKMPARLPVVLTVNETEAIVSQVSGTKGTMLRLLYGTGMRIIELVRIRVKDVDFESNVIIVRDGKGAKDRQASVRHVPAPHVRRSSPPGRRNHTGRSDRPRAWQRA